jgi:PTH1 family peptidyl-tRNA hydrolase
VICPERVVCQSFPDFFFEGKVSVSEETYLITGLGNPGGKYEKTRHNVGFVVIDALAQGYGVAFQQEKWDSLYCRVSIAGKRVYLLKPHTFMNLSGTSVARFAEFFKIPNSHILVLHDDLDMHPGRLKLVATGGPGGHNGIRSIIQCLGTKDFFRLKIGIGRPGQNNIHADMPVEHFVLAPFSESERQLLEERISLLLEGIQVFVEFGYQKAMNLLNSVK